MTNETAVNDIETFINQWGDSDMCKGFARLFQHIQTLTGVTLSFIARPGVSYSLRPKHQNQQARELFAIVDVIDDDPADRWLSVCFYGDMITDPQEMGEVIPGGLAGDDGYCFDIYEAGEEQLSYLCDRINEGYDSGSKEG